MVEKKKYEKVLIQTGVCSIIYGDFKGESNQELFRCPRSLDKIDLKQYVNDNNCLLGFELDENQDQNIKEIPGYLGYYRLYFRRNWYGKWMEADERIDKKLCAGIDEIIRFLKNNFPYGCNPWDMQEWLQKEYATQDNQTRYLLKPLFSDHYKIMFDTTYGHGDYPVRIYVYEQSETSKVDEKTKSHIDNSIEEE